MSEQETAVKNLLHSQVEIHLCKHCKAVFRSLYSLNSHISSAHSKLCELCGRDFSAIGKKNHQKLYHRQEMATCPSCKESFLTQIALATHAVKCPSSGEPAKSVRVIIPNLSESKTADVPVGVTEADKSQVASSQPCELGEKPAKSIRVLVPSSSESETAGVPVQVTDGMVDQSKVVLNPAMSVHGTRKIVKVIPSKKKVSAWSRMIRKRKFKHLLTHEETSPPKPQPQTPTISVSYLKLPQKVIIVNVSEIKNNVTHPTSSSPLLLTQPTAVSSSPNSSLQGQLLTESNLPISEPSKEPKEKTVQTQNS